MSNRLLRRSPLAHAVRLLAAAGLVLSTLPLSVLLPASLPFAPTAAEAAPGDLDTTFGTSGKTTTNFSFVDPDPSADEARGIALQSDGKILLAGVTLQNASLTSGSKMAVARYTAAGSVDASFGSGGLVSTLIADAARAEAVAVQPDGKIVVAGSAYSGGRDHFALARYTSAGGPDSGFGSSGVVTTPFGVSGRAEGYAVAIQADGKIVVAGRTNSVSGNDDFALARYNSNGSLDTSFSSDGLVTTNFVSGTGADIAHAVAIQGDGKIVAAGYRVSGSAYTFAVARYNTDGTLDTTFNTTGLQQTDMGGIDIANAVALQPDGKIIVAGEGGANTSMAVARYNTDGSLDTGFSSDGKDLVSFGSGNNGFGYGVALQANGKIVAAGYKLYADSSSDSAIVRFNTDGTLDSSFGTGGIRVVDLGSGNGDSAQAVKILADGNIVTAGIASPSGNSDFAVARFLGDPPTSASTYVVNSTFDSVDFNTSDNLCGDVTGNCSLRAAVMQARERTGAETITLPAGTYNLTNGYLHLHEFISLNEGITINGAGAASTIVDAGNLSVVFKAEGSMPVNLSGMTIRNGMTDPSGNGGGIQSVSALVTVTNSIITGNTADVSGGGIVVIGGRLNLTDSTVSGNTATNGNGGGILISSGTTGSTITRSTISGNIAGGSSGSGGGISIGGSHVNFVNSTISGNTASGGTARGGGIAVLSNSANILNSTITGNSAFTGAGLFSELSSGSAFNLYVENSIIANSTAGGDCVGNLMSGGFNVVEDPGACPFTATGDLTAQDPMLGSLPGANGGPTATHLPATGSPVIDAGNTAGCKEFGSPITVDQRGLTRPSPTGGRCDIGAVEVQQAPLPTLSINDVAIAEGNSGTTAMNFIVTQSATSSSAVNVSFTTAPGTPNAATVGTCGTPGADFQVVTTSPLTIAAGQTTGTIAVNACGDADVEPNETFFVNLSGPTNATIADGQGLGTITNDDSAPTTATITVVKDIAGGGTDPQDFNFQIIPGNGVGLNFNLDDDADGTLLNSATNTGFTAGVQQTVSEAMPPAGWSLASIVCVNNADSSPYPGAAINVANRTAIFTPAAGEHIRCTFTNNPPAAATPTIQITSDAGGASLITSTAAGSSVFVKGSGFAAAQNGMLHLTDPTMTGAGCGSTGNGVHVGDFTANGSGQFLVGITIPSQCSGTVPVFATNSGGAALAQINLTVTGGGAPTGPSPIMVTPSSGPPGQTFTLSGTGYPANRSGVNLFMDSMGTGSSSCSGANIGGAGTNANGDLSGAGSIPFACGPGTHQIKVFDGTDLFDSVDFTVVQSASASTAGLSLSQASAPQGVQVTLNGSGFKTNPPDGIVHVCLDLPSGQDCVDVSPGDAVFNNPNNLMAPVPDNTGFFSQSFFTDPNKFTVGTHTIKARGEPSGKTASVDITITSGSTAPPPTTSSNIFIGPKPAPRYPPASGGYTLQVDVGGPPGVTITPGSAKLKYLNHGAGQPVSAFRSVDLTGSYNSSSGFGTLSGTIPAQDLAAEGVDVFFEISFSNGQSARAPQGDGSFQPVLPQASMSQNMMFFEPQPVGCGPAGQPLNIVFKVSRSPDSAATQVTSAVLNYRNAGSNDAYKQVTLSNLAFTGSMPAQTGNQTFAIPGPDVTESGLEVFVQLTDNAGTPNTVRYPLAGSTQDTVFLCATGAAPPPTGGAGGVGLQVTITPENPTAGALSPYRFLVPVDVDLAAGTKLILTFPTVSGGDQFLFDANTRVPAEYAGFAANSPGFVDFANSGQAVVDNTEHTITLTLQSGITAPDALAFVVAGIKNTTVPNAFSFDPAKNAPTGGYTVNVTFKNAGGVTILGPLTTFPFPIEPSFGSSGEVTILVRDVNGAVGAGVKVFLHGNYNGDQEKTTDATGKVTFTDLSADFVSFATEPEFEHAGSAYVGMPSPMGIQVPVRGVFGTAASPLPIFVRKPEAGATKTLTKLITGGPPNKEIEVLVSGPNGFSAKQVQLDGSGAGSATFKVAPGDHFVSVSPPRPPLTLGDIKPQAPEFLASPPERVNIPCLISSGFPVVLNEIARITACADGNLTLENNLTSLRGTSLKPLAVRVVDQENTGVPGVQFWAAQTLSAAGGFASGGGGETDDNGDGETDVKPGTYTVGIFAPGVAGYIPEKTVNIAANGTQTPNPVLFRITRSTLKIALKVLQCTELCGTANQRTSPVPGAYVNAFRTGSGEHGFASAFTDGKGAAYLFVDSGTWDLEVHSQSGGISRRTGIVVGSTDVPVTIVREASKVVQIFVKVGTGASCATPIAFAGVGVEPLFGASDAGTGFGGGPTGSDGLAVITSIDAPASGLASYRIRAFAPDFGELGFKDIVVNTNGEARLRDSSGAATGSPFSRDSALCMQGSDTARSIRVEFPGGVPEAFIGAFNPGPPPIGNVKHFEPEPGQSGLTSATLRVPADGTYEVNVNIFGRTPQNKAGIVVPCTGPQPAGVACDGDTPVWTIASSDVPTRTISGTVRDSSNNAIADATVSVGKQAGGGGSSTKTGADGTYLVTVPLGTFLVGANKAGFLPGAHRIVSLPCTPTGTSTCDANGNAIVQDFVLRPLSDGSTIAGEVHNAPKATSLTVVARADENGDGRADVSVSVTLTATGNKVPYSLNVPPPPTGSTVTWQVETFAVGFETTPANRKSVTFPCTSSGAGVTCASQTSAASVDLTLTARTGASTPKAKAVQGALNGSFKVNSDEHKIGADIPAGSLDSSSDTGTITFNKSFGAKTALHQPDNDESIEVSIKDKAGKEIKNFKKNIKLKFQTTNAKNKQVGHWDDAEGDWKLEKKCAAKGDTEIECEVDHASKFSVITVQSVTTGSVLPSTPAPSGGGGGGGGGGSETPPAAPTAPPTSVNQPMNTATGGTVSLGDSVTVQVPANAVTSSTGSVTATLETATLTGFGTATVQAVQQTVPVPAGSTFGSNAFMLALKDASGADAVLTAAITVTAKYNASDLDKAAGNPSALRLMVYDAVSRRWTDTRATADVARLTLTGGSMSAGLFAVMIELPKPVLSNPGSFTSSDLAPLLSWTNPSGTTQFQVQVIPANNDGPGINLIMNADTSYQVMAPVFGQGPYVMLPGMTYTWRVRTSTSSTGLSETDPGWSNWAAGSFTTAPPSSSTINIVGPIPGGEVAGRTPTLTWSNSDPKVFYYEVQVSKDKDFGTDAFLYWELRHGAVSPPYNSYRIPDAFPLEAGTTYHWRVRPRVQGDGAPVGWSQVWTFITP